MVLHALYLWCCRKGNAATVVSWRRWWTRCVCRTLVRKREKPGVVVRYSVQRRGRTRLDKGYDGPVCRRALRKRSLSHLIPEKADVTARRQQKGRAGGRPCAFDKADYGKRNVVERCILRLKQFRRVATRYEKRAAVFEAVVTLAAIMLWIR